MIPTVVAAEVVRALRLRVENVRRLRDYPGGSSVPSRSTAR